MATFAPISYTYVPTAPRSKSTATRRQPAPKQSNILDKLQRSKLSEAALSMAGLAAADDYGGDELGIRVYDGNDDDNNCDLPSIEQLLYTTLQKDREQQEEQEQEDEDDGSNEGGREPQQEVREDVAATLMTGKVHDTYLSSKKDKSPGLAYHDPSPEPSRDNLGSPSCSNASKSDEDNRRLYVANRELKRPSSPNNGPEHKKRKHYLEQRSTH